MSKPFEGEAASGSGASIRDILARFGLVRNVLDWSWFVGVLLVSRAGLVGYKFRLGRAQGWLVAGQRS